MQKECFLQVKCLWLKLLWQADLLPSHILIMYLKRNLALHPNISGKKAALNIVNLCILLLPYYT